jgi:hypothetical protein
VQFHFVPIGFAQCAFGHGISQHAAGRAWDAMTPDAQKHIAIVDWALSDDGQSWGVQEVITGFGGPSPMSTYRWTGDAGWQPYSGPSAHRDHVHLSLTVARSEATTPPAQPLPPPVLPTPPVSEEDMFVAFRVLGYSDIGLIGPGTRGHVPSMVVFNDLLRLGLVKMSATGENWQWVTSGTYEFLTGEKLTSPE